jgi:hypothetical protein
MSLKSDLASDFATGRAEADLPKSGVSPKTKL